MTSGIRLQDILNDRSFHLFCFFKTLWWSIYLVGRWLITLPSKPQLTEEIQIRITPLFHGLFSFIFSMVFLCKYGFDLTLATNHLSDTLVQSSLAFFLYDFILCVLIRYKDPKTYFHHACAIGCLIYTFFPSSFVMPIIYGLFLGEASNFAMNCRFILNCLDLRYTMLYELMDSLYIVTYMLCRGIGGSILMFSIFMNPHLSNVIFAFGMALLIQSIYFMNIMHKILMKKFLHLKIRKEHDVRYWWLNVNPKVLDLEYTKKKNKLKTF